MDIQNRTLFFGDNLEVLKEKIPENFFDLIYLDPPFNSNRNYNVLFKEGQIDSSAQIHAFEDTWEWTEDTVRIFNELKNNPKPQIAILINSLSEFIGQNQMMAYLVNMTARLMPLHRVLKTTGSIYLHCDPTASHYLKIIMDVIFGKENFRNEIVWHYQTGGASKQHYSKKHDIILFYTKTDDYHFDPMADPDKRTEKAMERAQNPKGARIGANDIYKIPMDVWEIPALNPMDKERLDYPTQKPEKLLERIIKISSKEGDWILDPFCGCGTTVAVAERLNRNWAGIDISMQAVNVINQRMNAHYPGIQIHLDGIPMDFESAVSLAEKDKFSFQDWAITLVGASPPSGETKKGADRGIDGIILFYDREDLRNPKLKKIIVQVKGGNTNHRNEVSTLKGDIERDSAPMGVLITLHEPTSEMKREAALAGEYRYSESTSFPKIQLLSVKEWFEGKGLKLPTDKINPFKRAEVKADQNELF